MEMNAATCFPGKHWQSFDCGWWKIPWDQYHPTWNPRRCCFFGFHWSNRSRFVKASFKTYLIESDQNGQVKLDHLSPIFKVKNDQRNLWSTITWFICSSSKNQTCSPVQFSLSQWTLKKSLNFVFPTKYVIPKSLKFSHWPSKFICSPFPFTSIDLNLKLPFGKRKGMQLLHARHLNQRVDPVGCWCCCVCGAKCEGHKIGM